MVMMESGESGYFCVIFGTCPACSRSNPCTAVKDSIYYKGICSKKVLIKCLSCGPSHKQLRTIHVVAIALSSVGS